MGEEGKVFCITDGRIGDARDANANRYAQPACLFLEGQFRDFVKNIPRADFRARLRRVRGDEEEFLRPPPAENVPLARFEEKDAGQLADGGGGAELFRSDFIETLPPADAE